MVNRFKYKKITWVDLESPTGSELEEITKEFEIVPPVTEELKSPSLKPKVDLYEDSIFLILHFPAFKHSHISESNQEVDFVIGKDFLLTVHYDVIDPIHKFSKEFEVSTILDRNEKGKSDEHAGLVFFHLIKKLYHSLEHELEFIASSLDYIEDKIFIGREREVVEDISYISRDLLNFKQAMGSHKDVLESLEVAGKKFFGSDFESISKNIFSEYYKVNKITQNHRESLLELRDTNDSLLSTKQNEAMKVIAILAFVTFPLSLIASIFGMNTDYLPIVGVNGDFWIIVGVMGLLTLTFFLFFKHKDWI